jgi:hypothetical protein
MSIAKINVIRPLASKVLAFYFKDRPTGPRHPDFAHDPIGCPAIRDEQHFLGQNFGLIDHFQLLASHSEFLG